MGYHHAAVPADLGELRRYHHQHLGNHQNHGGQRHQRRFLHAVLGDERHPDNHQHHLDGHQHKDQHGGKQHQNDRIHCV